MKKLIIALSSIVSLGLTSPAIAQDAQFQSCLSNLKPLATSKGVNPDTYDQLSTKLSPDLSILDKLNYQPEFQQKIWDYLAALVDDERVADGQKYLHQYQSVLQNVEQRFGVDPYTVVAVWGVESNFGQITGKYPLLQALGTLSCYGRRQTYFKQEFISALRIAQSGDIALDQFNGSWAGAFGQTQFMPSTFERIAVDGDNDGRKDLINSVPDALASTANYLRRSGWQTGQPWGMEVKVPAHLNTALTGRTRKQNLSFWQNQGITLLNGQSLSNIAQPQTKSAILLPAGINGPAFLVFKNFDAIYSYNAAESYALAIALLSDRFKGQGQIQTPWPTDDLGLSRNERKELQQILISKGYSIGLADGMIGDKTREAIASEQTKLGLVPDGHAGQKILKALR